MKSPPQNNLVQQTLEVGSLADAEATYSGPKRTRRLPTKHTETHIYSYIRKCTYTVACQIVTRGNIHRLKVAAPLRVSK